MLMTTFYPIADDTDETSQVRDLIRLEWEYRHYGHSVICESATVLHCVNCQDYLREAEVKNP